MNLTGSADDWRTKASRTLDSARLLLAERDDDGACSTAYYAIFYSAHVVLIALGCREAASAVKTHRGLIALFGREAIKTGRFPPDLGKALDQVEQMRMTADYFKTSVTPDQAAWAVAKAEAFLEMAEAMIAKP